MVTRRRLARVFVLPLVLLIIGMASGTANSSVLFCAFDDDPACWGGGGGGDPCQEQQHLFRRGSTVEATGVRSEILVRSRNLDANCFAYSESHSTTHIRGGAFMDSWAEVGWVVDGTGGGQFRWFWETGIGSAVYHGHLGTGTQISCCGWWGFKVQRVHGTGRWKFYMDPGANGNFQQVGPGEGDQLNFNKGRPWSETARTSPGTQAWDDHRELRRKLCDDCEYNRWEENWLVADGIVGWDTLTPVDPPHQYRVVPA